MLRWSKVPGQQQLDMGKPDLREYKSSLKGNKNVFVKWVSGLIFLNYILWCSYGNVIIIGYSDCDCYRRYLLLLKVQCSWNKFALRLGYST